MNQTMNDAELKDILSNPALSAEHKERVLKQIEQDREPGLSPEATAMLRTFGKDHMRDVTEPEWLQYATRHGLTGREALCEEYWSWHCPDQRFMELISGNEGPQAQVEYWELVRRRTANPHVQAHALDQIKQLEKRP